MVNQTQDEKKTSRLCIGKKNPHPFTSNQDHFAVFEKYIIGGLAESIDEQRWIPLFSQDAPSSEEEEIIKEGQGNEEHCLPINV